MTGVQTCALPISGKLSGQKPSREDMENLLGIFKGTRRPWPAPANSKRQTIPKGVSGRKASECERRIRRAARPLGNLDSGHRRPDSQFTGQAHLAAPSLPRSRQFLLRPKSGHSVGVRELCFCTIFNPGGENFNRCVGGIPQAAILAGSLNCELRGSAGRLRFQGQREVSRLAHQAPPHLLLLLR